jgi:UDP-N-acetylglucosamine 4,6-dehydratase (inverting)
MPKQGELDGKSILVTGGTGSFGRKFVQEVLKHHRPRRLIVFSRDELKQHEMRQVFPDDPDQPVRYFVGDVRDRDRLLRAFKGGGGVELVVHAAALKQVPTCEYNPFEAVKTNILGTKNVIDAAIERRVPKVMLISTDKAVNPINLYGATKLCAEKMLIQANAYAQSQTPRTRLSVCRYGNVLGSRGSVVPLFLRQRDSGTVTITDSRMTRFWITLEQGVHFVLNCIETMHGGEIFVPKLPAMSLVRMAETLAPGCRSKVLGIRPGEKLHEVLVSEDEARHAVELEDKYVILPSHRWWEVKNYSSGRPLPEGFSLTSANDPWQLDDGELAEMLSAVLGAGAGAGRAE